MTVVLNVHEAQYLSAVMVDLGQKRMMSARDDNETRLRNTIAARVDTALLRAGIRP